MQILPVVKMTKWIRIIIYTFAIITITLRSSSAGGEYRIKVLPMVVVGQEYDDNIFLESRDERSDYITTVSPQITIDINSSKNGLKLEYAPTWVWYSKLTENNTVRHKGGFDFRHRFGKHLKFYLKDKYLESEDPFEETSEPWETQRTRHNRNPYQRNKAEAGLDYQFGPQNHCIVGYRHELLENKDHSLDDSTKQGPFGSLIYWFDIKNGTEISYRFTHYEFDREDDLPTGDDLDGHDVGVRYMHRLNPHSLVFVSYGLAVRDYNDLPVDYRVHDGRIGIEHAFSPLMSLALEAGYYEPDGDLPVDGGSAFSVSLKKRIRRGNIVIGIEKGWDEGYLDVESRSFTEYWKSKGSVDYELLKDLKIYAHAFYRRNKYELEGGEDDDTFEGQCGLSFQFLRWYSMRLNYIYVNRDSDNPDDKYEDNRIMMTLSASRPFRWTADLSE